LNSDTRCQIYSHNTN